MPIYGNLRGTFSPKFKIGKSGPTIWQDILPPDNGIGQDGDLFVVQDSSAQLYSKVSGNWFRIESENYGHLATTYRGVALTVATADTVIAVLRNPYTADSNTTLADNDTVTSDNNAGTQTDIVLPGSTDEGRELVIKDADGLAQLFTIRVTDGAAIDGLANQDIVSQHGYLELIYSGSVWRVVGR